MREWENTTLVLPVVLNAVSLVSSVATVRRSTTYRTGFTQSKPGEGRAAGTPLHR